MSDNNNEIHFRWFFTLATLIGIAACGLGFALLLASWDLGNGSFCDDRDGDHFCDPGESILDYLTYVFFSPYVDRASLLLEYLMPFILGMLQSLATQLMTRFI